MAEAAATAPILELTERLLTAAQRAGASSADVLAIRHVSLGLNLLNGQIQTSNRSEADDVGLRVLVGQRQAVVSTTNAHADVDELARRAVDMARLAPEDPALGLAEPSQLCREFPDLDLYAPVHENVGTLETLARRSEEAALGVSGVSKSGGASASCGWVFVRLAASNGFRGSNLVSSHGMSVTAIAGEGTQMERDYDYSSALHEDDLDSAETLGTRAGQRAVARLSPRKVPTCQVPVIFDRRVAGSLVGHFLSAINGMAIARQSSFLKDHMGKQVFSPHIRIIDDPRRRRGLGSGVFDAEGLAQMPLTLVDGGCLRNWLLDLGTARRLGLESNGRAARTPSGPLSPGSTNVHLEAGPLSPDEMIKDIDQGFYVTDLIGSGVNPVTGDYSRGASGRWIDKGMLSYAVSEVTLSGNLLEMFRTLSPASDLEFRHTVNAPSIRIDGLTLAGQ